MVSIRSKVLIALAVLGLVIGFSLLGKADEQGLDLGNLPTHKSSLAQQVETLEAVPEWSVLPDTCQVQGALSDIAQELLDQLKAKGYTPVLVTPLDIRHTAWSFVLVGNDESICFIVSEDEAQQTTQINRIRIGKDEIESIYSTV